LDYYRRLVRAGVPAVGGEMLFAGVLPDVFAASVRDLGGFAKGLG
jgi:acetyl esterase